MRATLLFLLPALLALLTGCATPESRIARHRAEFDQYPAAVQQKIKAGRIDIGFTEDMVRLALGEPVRKFNRRSDHGDTEVWAYDRSGPRFSVGIGMASGGYRSRVGGGVDVSSGGSDPGEQLRVEFLDGKVSEIDQPKK